jgi:hypothetical protein
MNRFLAELREQRWDDHRFYHRSRINQTLHLISATSFLITYALLLFTTHSVAAVVFGWLFAMCIRQVGHFFFEPKGFDDSNQVSHEYKESVKVGFNLRRKVILHSIQAAVPLALYFSPTFFGAFHQPWVGFGGYIDHLALLWLVLAGSALLFRTIHLFFIRSPLAGVVWFTKILTDPFHDIMLYHKAPIYLFKGQMIAPPAEQHA